MGSAGHAHLSAGRPGLHMPKLRHLEAVHGGWDRASAGLRTRGVRSQVNDEKPPWTLAACSLMTRPYKMTTNRKRLRPAQTRPRVALLQRDGLQPRLLANSC